MDKEIMDKLQEPFLPEEIEWRIGSTTGDKKRGLALAFITNRAIQNRLDEVFGIFGWKNEFREWRNDSQLCGISIKHGDEWITKWDGADNTEFESTKGGLSDSMKRAAYQWGIGRYLYKLEASWVPIKQQGRGYVMADDPPKLPEWALPKGYKPKSKPVQDLGKKEMVDIVVKISQEKGWTAEQLGKGIAHHFDGKTKPEQLSEQELNKLINIINKA